MTDSGSGKSCGRAGCSSVTSLNSHGKEETANRFPDEDRREQETRRRDIERKKIRLEELGTGLDTSVYREYEETSERVAFLEQERKDPAEQYP